MADKPEVQTIAEALRLPVITVPDAGRLFLGLGRSAAYQAAKRGDLPTVKIGGLILVPVAKVAEMLGLEHHIVEAAQ
jgi:hypothetical protein